MPLSPPEWSLTIINTIKVFKSIRLYGTYKGKSENEDYEDDAQEDDVYDLSEFYRDFRDLLEDIFPIGYGEDEGQKIDKIDDNCRFIYEVNFLKIGMADNEYALALVFAPTLKERYGNYPEQLEEELEEMDLNLEQVYEKMNETIKKIYEGLWNNLPIIKEYYVRICAWTSKRIETLEELQTILL